MALINQEIVLPFLGVIYIMAVFIVVIGYITNFDFGIIGIISWVIFIAGNIYFVYFVLSKIR